MNIGIKAVSVSPWVQVPVVITIYFWAIKVLATTVGETGSDYLIDNLHFGLSLTSLIMGVGLIILLVIQE